MAVSPADVAVLKNDKIKFMSTLLRNTDGTPFVPYDKQVEALLGVQPITTVCTGRQVGKTTMWAADCVHFSTTHANRQVFIIAPSLEQSRLMWNDVARHFRTKPLSSLVVGKIKEYPFPKIILKNGTEIHARGANSDQYIRGNRAHRVYVDEAAFIKDKVITDVIEPMFMVAGRAEDSALVLISTPFGSGTFKQYYDDGIATSGHKPIEGMASFHFTSLDNPYADTRRIARAKQRYGEDSLVWKTEYLGLFADSDLRVFSEADIQWAWEHYPGWGRTNADGAPIPMEFPVAPVDGHRYVQGADLANQRDFFVATVLDTSDSNLCQFVRMDRFKRRGYTAIKARIRANAAAYGCKSGRTLIDATSLGESVVEDLADIQAEGYKLGSNAAKHEIVQELNRMFQEHRLVIPPPHTSEGEIIVSELRYFEYKIMPSKTVRVEAVRGHDDIVMSLANAAHLALIPHTVGFFRGVDFGRTAPKKKTDPYDTAWWTDAFKESAA